MILIEHIIEKLKIDKDTAYKLIKVGSVYVNHTQIIYPNEKISENDFIEVKRKDKWVSRGAYKLLHAIKIFNLDFKDKVVLDIGSSTGGFTQVALEHEAARVYALDVGTNQLDYKLRSNKDVITLEKTNIKSVKKDFFNEKIDIVVCDISFISARKAIDAITHIMHKDMQIMILIKPQYEAKRSVVKEGGFVEEKDHDEIIESVRSYGTLNGLTLVAYDKSPITGQRSKNIEYISYWKVANNE